VSLPIASAPVAVTGARAVAAPSEATLRAARAALAVGGSILAGAGFAAVVRIALPRALGPATYGSYRLAESVAEVVMILLTLGLDTTLRRDVAQRPETAAERLWDVVRLRAYGGIVLALLGLVALTLGGAGFTVLSLFAVFALAQSLMSVSNAHTATLHAVGDARWPAAASVLSRGGWTVMALLALWWRGNALLVAAALALVEAVRLVALHRRSITRHGAAPVRATRGLSPAAWTAAVASLPIFVNFVAHSLYARLGLWVLGLRAPALEIGWFATASNVAGVALLGMPLVTWILLPAAASAGVRANDERDGLFVGALRAALLFAVPGALLLAVLADVMIVRIFGAEFAPAAGVLQRLAPTIGLAYLATIAAVSLLERGRERVVAAVSVGGLVVSVSLTLLLVRVAAPGEAAAGAALASLLTEVVVAGAMLFLAWRPSWTAPVARTAGGLAASVIGLALVSMLTPSLPLVPRLLLAVVVAVLPLIFFRAVRVADLAFARAVLFRRKSHASA